MSLYIIYIIILAIINGNIIFLTDFRKNYLSIKFYENPTSGRRVIPCGWTARKTWRR